MAPKPVWQDLLSHQMASYQPFSNHYILIAPLNLLYRVCLYGGIFYKINKKKANPLSKRLAKN